MADKPVITKKELDKLNAEIKRLKAPQTPQMAPAPGGPMRQQATKVQIAARKQATEAMEKKAEHMSERLYSSSEKGRKDFNQASGKPKNRDDGREL